MCYEISTGVLLGAGLLDYDLLYFMFVGDALYAAEPLRRFILILSLYLTFQAQHAAVALYVIYSKHT